jgi:hypothetical protein
LSSLCHAAAKVMACRDEKGGRKWVLLHALHVINFGERLLIKSRLMMSATGLNTSAAVTHHPASRGRAHEGWMTDDVARHVHVECTVEATVIQ